MLSDQVPELIRLLFLGLAAMCCWRHSGRSVPDTAYFMQQLGHLEHRDSGRKHSHATSDLDSQGMSAPPPHPSSHTPKTLLVRSS